MVFVIFDRGFGRLVRFRVCVGVWWSGLGEEELGSWEVICFDFLKYMDLGSFFSVGWSRFLNLGTCWVVSFGGGWVVAALVGRSGLLFGLFFF